ncbi:MAG: hypothetical protein AB4058_03050, partial [Microcystaceae cyanobacterium]
MTTQSITDSYSSWTDLLLNYGFNSDHVFWNLLLTPLVDQLDNVISSNIIVENLPQDDPQSIRVIYPKDQFVLSLGGVNSQIPFLKDFVLDNPEIFFANTQNAFRYTPLDADGDITVYRGINFITNLNFNEVDNAAIELITDILGNPDVIVQLFIDPDGFITLNGTYQQSIELIDWGDFKVTYADPQLEWSMDHTSSQGLAVKASLILNGYDPFNDNEPELKLTGALGIDPTDPTSVSIAGNLDLTQSGTVWRDPFGLKGVEVKRLAAQFNYDSKGVMTGFGYSGTLTFGSDDLGGKWDIDTDILLDADPKNWHNNAFLLTINDPLSLVDLWVGPVASSLLQRADSFVNLDIVGKALDFLDELIDVEISSFDSDGDGENDPLIYFVPFPTTIGTKLLESGFAINGKITAWDQDGFLLANVDKETQTFSASLELPTLDWDFLKITGVNDPTLDLAVKVSNYEQYIEGNGQLEIFDIDIATVDFKISHEAIIIKDFDLSFFDVAAVDVDNLYVGLDYENPSASGTGKLTLFGQALNTASFNIEDYKVDLSNINIGFSSLLGLNNVNLSLDPQNLSGSGSGNLTLFGQSISNASFAIEGTQISLDNVNLGFGSFLGFNNVNLSLDPQNLSGSGSGKLQLFGQTIANSAFEVNGSRLALKNINLGFGSFFGFNDVNLVLDPRNYKGSGSGSFMLFGQSIASGSFDIDGSKIAIKNVNLGFDNILEFSNLNLT